MKSRPSEGRRVSRGKRLKRHRSSRSRERAVTRTRRERVREQTRTIRKSRRLALKHHRQQQTSPRVSDVFHMTPRRRKHATVSEAAAEQVAEATAARQDEENRVHTPKHSKDRAVKRTPRGRSPKASKPKSTPGKKGRVKPRRSFFSGLGPGPTPRQSLVDMFWDEKTEDDASEGSTAMSESDEEDEPNTEDRRFIKAGYEAISDDEYVPTDPEEFDEDDSRVASDLFAAAGTIEPAQETGESKSPSVELDTKEGEMGELGLEGKDSESKGEDDGLARKTPTRKTNPDMHRQITPEFTHTTTIPTR